VTSNADGTMPEMPDSTAALMSASFFLTSTLASSMRAFHLMVNHTNSGMMRKRMSASGQQMVHSTMKEPMRVMRLVIRSSGPW